MSDSLNGGLGECFDHYEEEAEPFYEMDRDDAFAKTVAMYRQRYEQNKLAKIGEIITCPICGQKELKRTYHHCFCSTRHKDKYWNRVDMNRRNRAAYYAQSPR